MCIRSKYSSGLSPAGNRPAVIIRSAMRSTGASVAAFAALLSAAGYTPRDRPMRTWSAGPG
jgi:hypothetical protein